MRQLLTIAATVAMAWVAVFIGGSVPALALLLHPGLIENLAIPALLAVPATSALVFWMGTLVFRKRRAANPTSICIAAGVGLLSQIVGNLAVSVPGSITPISCAAYVLACLFVGLPLVWFRWLELPERTRIRFIAAAALAFGATLGFSEHHSIRPAALAITPLRPSPNVPRFNSVGVSLEDYARQQQVRREAEQAGKNAAASAAPGSARAATPDIPPVPPGLDREQRFQEAFRNARDAGTLPRDPVLDRMREAVVNGAAWVKAAPCDDVVRGVLHDAIITFIRDMPRIAFHDVEMISAEGITRSATIVFNQPALKVTRAALHAGLVSIDDLPAPSRPSFAGPQPADAIDLAATLHCPELSDQHWTAAR
jgi:hypothetical protein